MSKKALAGQVGFGYDIHRLARGRPLILGGVTVPFAKGLKGHSDADVVTHAVIDALLGAAGLGDIGGYFPDTDPRYKGAASIGLLEKTKKIIQPRFHIQHVDVTLVAEAPPLGPYKNRMRARLARAMALSPGQVNVKAKTNEGLGLLGARKAMAAWAVATLSPKN